MRRSRSSILAIAALCVLPATARAQAPSGEVLADSARRAIEAAVIAGDVDAITQSRAFVERALARYPGDAWLAHYRGYALYREATLRRGLQPDLDVDATLEAAQQALEASLAIRDIPESRAILSSVLGQRIGSSPLRGITMGPRSGSQMERAVSDAPANPRVWLLRGIGALYMPRAFGGGADRAEQYIREAIALFPNDTATPPAPAWGHDEAWLWLGRVHEQNGKLGEARTAYVRALEIQPGNTWVRDVLLPGIEGRISGG